MVDLHVHTTASDGTLSPSDTVKHAKKMGIEAIAITDHDTISGIDEAMKTGDLVGVEVIPGIEISVDYNGEMHILGFFINKTEGFSKWLNEFRATRKDQNTKIIQMLNELGFNISFEEVEEFSKEGSIGRPHIASVLMKKGYVKSINEAFDKYIGAGKKAYVERVRISPKEGIDAILKAGGIPVLAHPKFLGLDENKLDNLLSQLKSYGLKGIEAYYSLNTSLETGLLLRLAIKHNLLVTGGTDYHGSIKPDIEMGIGLGDTKVNYSIVNKLKEAQPNKFTFNN